MIMLFNQHVGMLYLPDDIIRWHVIVYFLSWKMTAQTKVLLNVCSGANQCNFLTSSRNPSFIAYLRSIYLLNEMQIKICALSVISLSTLYSSC